MSAMSSKQRLAVYGNPEKLVETVLSEAKRDLSKRIEEAYSAARELLDEEYRKSLQEVEKAIINEAKELREKLKALEASNEVELRMLESKIKSEFVEKVLEEALSRAPREIPREAYKRFLASQLKEALQALKRYTSEGRVIACKPDRGLLEELVGEVEVEGIEAIVASETLEGCGGFILESSDRKVRLDYRLQTVLQPFMDELRAIALRNLFRS